MPREVTSEDATRIKAQYLEGGSSSPLAREMIQNNWDAMPPHHPTMPIYSEMKVSTDGSIWLRPYVPFRDGSNPAWLVLANDGPLLGEVQVPPNLTRLRFAADRIIGLWTDSLDIEHVRAHRILKR
jgi:hypothetical protein